MICVILWRVTIWIVYLQFVGTMHSSGIGGLDCKWTSMVSRGCRVYAGIRWEIVIATRGRQGVVMTAPFLSSWLQRLIRRYYWSGVGMRQLDLAVWPVVRRVLSSKYIVVFCSNSHGRAMPVARIQLCR